MTLRMLHRPILAPAGGTPTVREGMPIMNGMSDRKAARTPDAGKTDAGKTETKAESQGAAYSKVAADALGQVAMRAKAVRDSPDARNIEMLFDAAVGDDPLACSALAKRLVANGTPAEYICDVYIPAVARRMGDDWCEDEASFTSVTIGTSRLQFLLREIGPGKSDDRRWNSNGQETSVLLLLSRDADHTLGIMVLAGQLRRLGYSVKLSIGEEAVDLVNTIKDAQFDAVFVSASMEDDLADLTEVVKMIKSACAPPPPVILGGYIVEGTQKALKVSGVDKITNKLEEALSFCKLHGHPK